MKKPIKKMSALLAAITVIAMCPLSAAANTLETGEETEEGVKYMRNDNGETEPFTGWTNRADKCYYYKNGIMKRNCWLRSKGERTYFLGKDGSMTTGKITLSGIEYEFDSTGHLIKDGFGISINTSDVTPEGMTMEITFERPADDCTFSLITSEGKYISVFCGDEYTIEKYTLNIWETVPYITDDILWNDEAEELNGNASFIRNIKWNGIYGILESGKYRLCKKIYYSNDEGEWVNKVYYGYFSI